MSGIHNVSTNRDNVTDSLSIVVVPCRHNGGLRGKGGQLSQSLASQIVAVEARGATVPTPCRLLFRDRHTQYKHAIVVLTVRQLSLSVVGTMVAMVAREGKCSCPLQVQWRPSSQGVATGHERNPHWFAISAHTTSTRCKTAIMVTTVRLGRATVPIPGRSNAGLGS